MAAGVCEELLQEHGKELIIKAMDQKPKDGIKTSE